MWESKENEGKKEDVDVDGRVNRMKGRRRI